MKVKFLSLSLLAITLVNAQNKPIQLIPQPVEMKQSEGFYELTSKTTLSFSHAELRLLVEMLAQKLNTPTGFSIKPIQGKTGTIKLLLNDVINPQIGIEGYVLEVTKKGVVITANQVPGLYYGIQTLLQLLP
ncbi:MAG: glycoside hydrolase family 20 zincin-like fold domain-containing protein, partial [Salinivirgaceae bacterium]|nr:glycoside hydrolase family 20 zincin-like fold domain-containing protein [Salinivirgaceae bacterium]